MTKSLPDALPWHEGAYVEAADKPSVHGPLLADDTEIVFDDTTTRRSTPDTGLKDVHSIPRLSAQKKTSGDSSRFKKTMLALPDTDTPTLILRIATTTDALTLWALHATLDKREIAPCLRWPQNDSTPQMKFITWVADLLWFCRRNPDHHPKSKGYQRLLAEKPAAHAWHERAYWMFARLYGRRSLAHITAVSLALTDTQRQALMTLPTSLMVTDRLELSPDRYEAKRERLCSYAVAHPDKSGTHRPEAVANRRVRLWRVHVLAGRSKTDTAKHWQLLTGQTITRQAVAKQLDTTETILWNPKNGAKNE
ncbi:MAG: hypothetical protein PHS32_12130 [Rhodoferax sp.]|uniref:hypothetical protein n=1 Tax=Rhodoferax sp. TaxID=50421 RepID=UPI00260D1F08|nr:hypothetical protein [Rhodoferax sp.]MDD5334480.1 hypothetical protein [Rhodoferax sp.]